MNNQTHRYAHLPIPSEKEMIEIINTIEKHKNDPQALAIIDEVTPPHIMQALLQYSIKEAEQAEQWAREAEQLAQRGAMLTEEILQFKKSIQHKLN